MDYRTNYTNVEDYRRLSQEYEANNADYQALLAAYREKEAAGQSDPETERELASKSAALQEQYEQLLSLRREIAVNLDMEVVTWVFQV